MQIGIYIFDNVEVLDFAGPYEVFTCASRVNRGETPLFNVFTVGETLSPVHARAGLKIAPDFSLANHPAIDCLIIPGGVVSAELDKGRCEQVPDMRSSYSSGAHPRGTS
jgi:transcriptional regulator GlxA family with amidase domain